jgi:TPP-dependent 2-oxoacid decarboxylase
LNGSLGETIDKVIETYAKTNRPVYIEREQTPPTPVTPNPPHKQTGVLPQSADTTEEQ